MSESQLFLERQLGKGGTYTPLWRGSIDCVRTVVLKQIGGTPQERKKEKKISDGFGALEAIRVLRDFFWARKCLEENGINTPKILGIGVQDANSEYTMPCLSDFLLDDNKTADELIQTIIGCGILYDRFRILFLEEDCGTSVRELIRNEKFNNDTRTKLIEMINKMPENVELDINPANFVVDKHGKITFVDTMPPRLSDYKNDPLMKDVFPSVVHVEDGEDRREFEYVTKAGRIERFERYLDDYQEQILKREYKSTSRP